MTTFCSMVGTGVGVCDSTGCTARRQRKRRVANLNGHVRIEPYSTGLLVWGKETWFIVT